MSATTTPSSSISFFSSSIFLSSSHHSRYHHPANLLCKTTRKPPPQLALTTTTFTKAIIRTELAAIPILSFEGTQVGSTALNLKSAPLDTARSVVHRGLTTDLRNRRRGTASTLTRSEVRGGGIKPYPQKKTGRARRGSQRTPLRPGGGVVFGPKPKDWSVKINKKEKRLAISTAISSSVENTIVVEDFEDKFEKLKTKEFIALMRRWGLDPKEKSVFLMTEVLDNVKLSGRNIGTLKMLTPRTLNLFDILDFEKLVFTRNGGDGGGRGCRDGGDREGRRKERRRKREKKEGRRKREKKEGRRREEEEEEEKGGGGRGRGRRKKEGREMAAVGIGVGTDGGGSGEGVRVVVVVVGGR